MARQVNGLKLEGTVGNLSFYKSGDGYLVRKKSSLSKKRIKTDPAFANTRKLNAEFSRAARAVRIFRAGFASLIGCASDHHTRGRLLGAMIKAMHADVTNDVGKRTIKDGEAQLLEGFEFNEKAPLREMFRAPLGVSFDCEKGEVIVDIPSFSVFKMMHIPPKATHFRFLYGCGMIDFEDEMYSFTMSEGDIFKRTRRKIGPLGVSLGIEQPHYGQLFVLFGVELFKIEKKTEEPFNGGKFNSLAIVKAGGEVN